MSDQLLGFVHRFEPAQPATSTPTLLLLHGTGGNENDLIELGRTLSPNTALLSPRGRVLENGMPRFFRRLAEGVFDLDDLQRRTHELADFVAAAASQYGLDAGNVIAVGYSNGANIAAAMMLLRPEILSGAVLFRAMLPLEPQSLPDLHGRRALLAAGRYDRIVPAPSVERLSQLLTVAGADAVLRWEEAGHNLTQNDIQLARKWLNEAP